jgi:Mrp family chromosome partitioning ATPase/capsular polysaccharide biosynthesis protein
VDVRDLGAALWRQKVLVLLILVVAGVGAAVGLRLAPKTYSATASVFTRQDPTSTESTSDLNELRATVAELASSSDVAVAVQSRLHDVGVEREVSGLEASIEGEWVTSTFLIRVSAEDRDPEVAALIANLVVDELDEVTPASGAFEFEVSEQAVPPDRFSDPDLRVMIPLSAVAAALLAAFGAVLRDRWANTVDDASGAEDAALAPLLAHLAPPRDPSALPTLQPGTAAADRFRHLRLAFEGEAGSGVSKKIVVAGATSGDSTVWLAANVAIALAGVGRRVLLVDGRMGERFGRPVEQGPDTPGLYDVLCGAPIQEAVSPGPVELLSVLPPGNFGREPVGPLLEARFGAVMDRVVADFDVAVVLAPPLDVCDDARLMSVGGSLVLTVPEGAVSRSKLRAQTDKVRALGARVLGVVLIGRRAEPVAA